jgi:parallel beta-helix repeat protein
MKGVTLLVCLTILAPIRVIEFPAPVPAFAEPIGVPASPLSRDRLALSGAIAATPDGGVLRLNRNYTLDGTVEVSKQITIEGGGFAISSSGTSAALSVTASGVRLNNLWLDYDSGVTQSAVGSSPEYEVSGLGIVVSNSADGVIVEGSRFTGRFQSAILVKTPSVDTLTVRGNEFQDNYYGVLIDNSGPNTGLVVADNRFERMAGDPITLNNPVYVHERNFANDWGRSPIRDRTLVTTNFVITGNEIIDSYAASSSTGLGISVAGAKYGLISGNLINGSSYSGIHLEDDATNIVIRDNRIFNIRGYQPGRGEDVGWNGFSGAIWLHDSSNIQILDNWIEDSVDSGIFLTLADGATRNENIAIAGNYIARAGDSIRATGWNVTISGNRIDTPIKRYDYAAPFDWIRVFDSQ